MVNPLTKIPVIGPLLGMFGGGGGAPGAAVAGSSLEARCVARRA